jgi:hypothetical protein
MSNKVNQILQNLKITLEMAQYGLMDLKSKNVKFHELGLRNLAMHGRSVTFVLQNMRGKVEGFEEWYKEIQEEMKSSELCSFFRDLRNEIEKQGKVRDTSINTHISQFNTDMLDRLPRPKNAKILGFFMGDQLGGSGWGIELPDGTTDKIYLDLPKEIVNTKRFFSKSPQEHLGRSLENKTIQELGEIYYDYLSEIVGQALRKFG